MPKGALKKNKKTRTRHPMSAGRREPGRRGQARNQTKAAIAEQCGPTKELLAQLAKQGPTDLIQRAVANETLTDEQGRALEVFAGIRRIIGVAEFRKAGTLGELQPKGPSHTASDERIEKAMDSYREACVYLDAVVGAFDACVSICDNAPVRNVKALRQGANALALLFIQGSAKAA